MLFIIKILIIAFCSICITYTNVTIYNRAVDWVFERQIRRRVRICLSVLLWTVLTIISYGSPLLLIIMTFGA